MINLHLHHKPNYSKWPKISNPLFHPLLAYILLSMLLLLKILSGMANSVDPDQTAPSGAVWSGSTLFAYVILSDTLVFGILGHLPYIYMDTSHMHYIQCSPHVKCIRIYHTFDKPLKRQSQLLSSALSSAGYFKSHFCKQCGPRSDCSFRSSLIWVHTVCLYAKIGLKSLQEYSADDIKTTFSDASFLGALRVKLGLFWHNMTLRRISKEGVKCHDLILW